MSRIANLAVCAAIVFSVTAHSQSPTDAPVGHGATCAKNNADARAQLASSSGMPPGSRALFEFITEDAICECMQVEASPAGVTDPEVAYIEVNAVCLTRHAKLGFERLCLSGYREILTAMGYSSVSQTQLGAVCSCGQKVIDTKLTLEGTRQNLLNAYEEYKARIAGRRREEIRRVPLHQNSFESLVPETLRCAVQTMGAPR